MVEGKEKVLKYVIIGSWLFNRKVIYINFVYNLLVLIYMVLFNYRKLENIVLLWVKMVDSRKYDWEILLIIIVVKMFIVGLFLYFILEYN